MWALLKVFQISATFRAVNSDGRWVMLTMNDVADAHVSGWDCVVRGDTRRDMVTGSVIVASDVSEAGTVCGEEDRADVMVLR